MGVVEVEVVRHRALESYDDGWRILVTREAEDGGYTQFYEPKYYYSYTAAVRASREIEIDGDLESHKQYLSKQADLKNRQILERNLYLKNKGNFAFVARSSRKHKGKIGFVFWCGKTAYGWSVGIDSIDGERFFVPFDYVECFPIPEEMIDQIPA